MADIAARLFYGARESVEWLHKHQVTCSRALFRTFDELRKIRRDFGADPAADEPAERPPAPDSRPEAAPASGPREINQGEDAHAPWEADESRAVHPSEV